MTQKLTDAEMAEIEQLLQSGYCNPVWRKHVSKLITEVNRLKRLLEATEPQGRSMDLGDDYDFANDTVFL